MEALYENTKCISKKSKSESKDQIMALKLPLTDLFMGKIFNLMKQVVCLSEKKKSWLSDKFSYSADITPAGLDC